MLITKDMKSLAFHGAIKNFQKKDLIISIRNHGTNVGSLLKVDGRSGCMLKMCSRALSMNITIAH